jgi:hypothetical protein
MEQGALPTLPAYPIKERLEIGGVNVLLLNVPPDQAYPQNVFGVSEKGDVLWQVEQRPSDSPNPRYTSIKDETGVIVARTEGKIARKIDPKNGKVLSEEQAGE